jgi:hypothetical protein
VTRGDRRRQAKADADLIERGIDPEHIDLATACAVARQTYRLLDKSIAAKAVDPLVEFQHQLLDASARWWQGPNSLKAACRKGCWFCCTTWVASTGPQSIFFVKSMRPERRRAFETRLGEMAQLVATLSHAERITLPRITSCPALDEGICSNYQNRPLVCRSASSMDAEVCRRTYIEFSNENVPTPAAPLFVRDVISQSFKAAALQHGLDGMSYEFICSANRCLEASNVEGRWLLGEKVFEGVPIDPSGGPEMEAAIGFLRRETFDGWES